MEKEAKTEEVESKDSGKEYEDFEEESQAAQGKEETMGDENSEELTQLKNRLEEKEKRIEGLQDRIQHLQADFENYKKRHKQEIEDTRFEARGDIIVDLVSVYDNLDRAFKSFEKNDDTESFIEGVEKIYAQFTEVLSKRDVCPIEAEGEKFDPKKHQALMKVESDDDGHNEVTEEFERGYMYRGKVLKPSKVKVNVNPPEGGD